MYEIITYRSHILEAHIRAQIITKRTTLEGEVLPIHQEEIKVGGYGEDEDRILLFWPTTIVHQVKNYSLNVECAYYSTGKLGKNDRCKGSCSNFISLSIPQRFRLIQRVHCMKFLQAIY